MLEREPGKEGKSAAQQAAEGSAGAMARLRWGETSHKERAGGRPFLARILERIRMLLGR